MRDRALSLGLAVCFVLAGASAQAAERGPLNFSRDIRPILSEHCLGCHGADKPQADFRLTSREAALGQGESGHVGIVPGKPAESELVRRITAADLSERMPPEEKKALKLAEIELLKRWVAEGAHWGGHWAFEPIASPVPPEVQHVANVRNEIDRFVLARLDQEGVTPSPEADRYTLIKRLSYDLLGLPPTVAEVDAFVNDASPGAYEALVDRLLKSPHFGERWGRHWLDLARYADSDGYEKDRARGDAYLFRDWVIEAINRDLPYDRFTVEQIAGDLLPGATARERLATAFNRQTLTNEEGGVDQEEYRINAVFDRTETLGTVWLGMTVGCARCHSHKYDPLPHDEYYRLFAFFNNADETSTDWPTSAKDLEEYDQLASDLQAALDRRHRALAKDELAWETAEREKIMSQSVDPLAEHEVTIVEATAEASKLEFEKGSAWAVAEGPEKERVPPPDKDVYSVVFESGQTSITGLKLWTLANDLLPGKGPGRAPNGNFVLTGFKATVIRPDGTESPLELHRASADFTQAKFSPEHVLSPKGDGPSGWAIAPKMGEKHWLLVRTAGRVDLEAGSKIRLVLEQNYGGAHTLGRFRVMTLTGDERGIHFARKDIADALEMYPEKRVASVQRKLFDYYVSDVLKDAESQRMDGELRKLKEQYAAKVMSARTLTAPLLERTTYVFDRGDFQQRTQKVEPGTPVVLGSFQPRSTQPDRLDLAQWLISPEQPLTARVAVNHVWRHLFGEGLVRTPGDFGLRGEPPSHPELLDWLATKFRGDLGWSRKQLIRLIVTSATYRQSSAHRPELVDRDPLNVWLARQSRFRVEAEIVRDLNLAVSGLLTPKIGGPSVFPPMPADLAALSYANSFSWKNSEGADRYRRGMYTFFKRTVPHPSLMTFDSPDANLTCVARTVSNTPLQALQLLNSEAHVEATQAMAKWLLEESAASDAERLTRAWRQCVARPPTEGELAALAELLAKSRAVYEADLPAAKEAVGTYAAKDVEPTENAAWVATLRVVLNLDEFVTRE
ncbi:PSD1 and planctomycete cytochrome C domain-containing protein [Planctellipticum variicoloris]|uniref:PSD1 and planctomycete cytochrome C domain-containing protein n=1 Tax=Planctellipticum variicoloris TaxID=3064265 RepID=UPI003013A6B5|nr:PSD1 and planctomycete cytochrome C domain-containing protein [Planctomycetaceae bacterium SH412]